MKWGMLLLLAVDSLLGLYKGKKQDHEKEEALALLSF